MDTNKTPLGLAGTGVILIVVGLAVKALVPALVEVGSFVVSVGWVAIFVAVILFIVAVVRGSFR